MTMSGRRRLLSLVSVCSNVYAFTTIPRIPRPHSRLPLAATVAPQSTASLSVADLVLSTLGSLREEANGFAETYGLSPAEATIYGLFAAVRKAPCPLGLKGSPFVLRHMQIVNAFGQDTNFIGFFTMTDLQKALEDDFLDAARGSTDPRTGWKITDVSQPRGDSFEEARMTFDDVQAALNKGTVIFNAAGAHIPKLAGPSLACTDGTLLPCAMNLYVTDHNQRISAPPHTDKQDVVVIQTAGRKHWRVYSPPDSSLKPATEMFARGKFDDRMPLHVLEESGSQLLLETILNPGDVLFCPAAFPHTTSTVVDDDASSTTDSAGSGGETSIHLTLNIDHHIWELDYLCARRLALRRAGVPDTALGQERDGDNPYVGKCNELPQAVRKNLFAALPLGLLVDDTLVEKTAKELERISHVVDEKTASAVDKAVWQETVIRLRQQGVELLQIHRDMYLAALQEGELREAEDAMTAHLGTSTRKKAMTPERIQRLSLFRVKGFYDEIEASIKALKDWSFSGSTDTSAALENDWAFTLPVTVGQKVEADLGGAYFPATVTRASGGTYDVQFFDGDKETGLTRSEIKLLSPPTTPTDADTSKMTSKQLKRWKKEQEKLQKNG